MMEKNEINWEEIEEIKVRSQEELYMVPNWFKGTIFIEFGVKTHRALLNRSFPYGKVIVHNNAYVEVFDNVHVEVFDNVHTRAWGTASVIAHDNAYIMASSRAYIIALDDSFVVAYNNVSVMAHGNASVIAWDGVSATAWDDSFVVAHNEVYVRAYGKTCIKAYENVQVKKESYGSMIETFGNARIVYRPKNVKVEDFLNFYGIEHDKMKAIFYKAVHRIPDIDSLEAIKNQKYQYFSDYNSDFEYVIGEEIKIFCDPNTGRECSNGIHISYLNWALNFGYTWPDMAILEVETQISDIIIPKEADGKVRTPRIKVLREVPLEECGLYGKILIKEKMLRDIYREEQ